MKATILATLFVLGFTALGLVASDAHVVLGLYSDGVTYSAGNF